MASTSRSARYARWLALPVGLVISAVLIWQASYAAFTDTTENAGNSWTAGTVTITDTDDGVAMFTATDLVPGAPAESKTITATYEGSLDADVTFYGANFRVLKPTTDGSSLEAVSGTEDTLAEHIMLTINATAGSTFGTGPTGTIYTGTLAAFAKEKNSFDTGYHYTASGDAPHEQGTFEFTYWVEEATPNSVQGQQVTIDFVAEAKSAS